MTPFRKYGVYKALTSPALLLIVLACFPSSATAVTFTRKPFLQNITPSSAEIRWVTDTKEQLVVKYGTTTSYGSQVASNSVSGTGGSNNHALITGLAANTKYYYQILTSGGTALTAAGDANHYIKTAPPVGSTAPFSFAIWGDSGNNSTNQNNVAKQIFARKPNLALIAGDIAYPYSTDFANNNSKHFNQYNDTKAGQNTMSFAPFYDTCGNHETSCQTVIADHSYPGGGSQSGVISTYSYDWGNAHFVALNTNSSFYYNATSPLSSDPQVKWAYNDLKASNQPWKVLYFHHNGWSAGSHSTNQTIVDNLVRMASDTGVDLVVWGHSHVYERWNKKTGYYPGVQAITIGNGGQAGSSSCTSTSPGPGCAYHNSTAESGFIYAQVNGNQMTLQYIRADGSNPDTFTLNSGGTVTSTPTPTRSLTLTPTPTGNFIPGDLNRDGKIDIFDYNIMITNYGNTACGNVADINGDCKVDIFDYNILVTNYGKTG